MIRTFCLILLSSALVLGQPQPHSSGYTIGPSLQPLVIIGEGWSQQFTFINVDYYQSGSSVPEPTVGTLRFIRSDGTDWQVPLRNYGIVNQIPVNLVPGQMLSVETEVLNTPQVLGWALLDLPNSNSWGIYHSFTTFRKQLQGRPDFLTSVPFVDGLEDEWIIPFDNRGGKVPGIGVVNTSNRGPTTYRFDVYDSAGTLRRTFIKTVAAKNLAWFSLVDEYPELAGIDGQIRVTGGFLASAVVTLQFAPNGAFTAIPVVHTYGIP